MSDLYALVYGQAYFYGVGLALLYLFLAGYAWRNTVLGRKQASAFERALLVLAAAQHTLLLSMTVWVPSSHDSTVLALGFAQAFSLATCVGVWLFVLEERWVGIYALRTVALTMPAAATLLATFIPAVQVTLPQHAALHVLCAIAAHGVALLACGHALLLYGVNRLLKHTQQQGWLAVLTLHSPPLVVLEHLLIRLSLWTASLLALTVVLGGMTGLMRFDHKTLLTILSLAAWLNVWWGYEKRGWRANKLTSMVLVATGFLLLAYIGSRFVLQTVLHRI